MAQTMTPSQVPITDDQIEKAADQLRAALRKHRAELDSEAAQKALGTKNIGMMLLAPFRALVEHFSNMVVRTVEKIDRSRSPQEMLDATGRKQYTDRASVESMPRGEGDTATLAYFKPRPEAYDSDGLISDDRLAEEFEYVGLEPDPAAQMKHNADDPAFADKYPNATHWKDADGNWHYASFHRWYDERDVRVYRLGRRWDDDWWFAGRRKVSA